MSGLANLNGFSVARTTAYTELQVATLNAVNALVGGLVYGAATITAPDGAGGTGPGSSLGNPVVLDVTTPVTFLDTTNGAQFLSLPNGGKSGQQKQFIKTIDGGDSTLTPEVTVGGTTNF